MNGHERLVFTLISYLENRDTIDAEHFQNKMYEILALKRPEKVLLDKKEMDMFNEIVEQHKEKGLVT